MKVRVILTILIISVFGGCSQGVRLSNINLAHSYNNTLIDLTPNYSIIHQDFEISRIDINIPSTQLLYLRDAREDIFLSKFQITIKVYEWREKGNLLFNSEIQFTDTLQIDDDRLIERAFTFPLALGKDYHIYIRFEDKNRRSHQEALHHVEKMTRFSPGFFFMKSEQNQIMFPYPFVLVPNLPFTLTHVDGTDFKMDVNRYIPDNTIPIAPYVVSSIINDYERNFISDTTFTISFDKGVASFALPGNGIYRINKPGEISDGFTVSCFWDEFPELPENELMLNPLRYITAVDEYNAILAVNNAPLATERFWTRIVGNPDRGFAVMKRYNDRVIKSNQLFSSHVPGWQTDRGMIYIVFGPPDMVYISTLGETWFYGESLNTSATEFQFIRKWNVLSHNHFILERNQTFRRNWNFAVDRWRR